MKKIINKHTIKISPKKQNQVFWILFFLIFGWFLYQTLFFAFNINKSISPDEDYHVAFINYYTKRDSLSPIISKQEDNFTLGDISRTPSYLYHYLLGLIQKLPFIGANSILILRCINIIFSVLTIFVFYKLMTEFKLNRLLKLTSIFILTNTLMFTFLSGTVNYDNLANLISIISFLLLYKFVKYKNIQALLLLFVLFPAGVIIKVTLLPLFFIEGIISLFFIVRDFKLLKKEFLEYLRKTSPIIKTINIIFFLIFSALFLERIGINIFRYNSFSPSCLQIHTEIECRSDAQYIQSTEILPLSNRKIIRPFNYLATWEDLMTDRSVGIFGHKTIQSNFYLQTYFIALIFLSIIAFSRKYDRKKDQIVGLFIGVIIIYSLILFNKNYQDQMTYNVTGLAVQGRYLFPVYPIFLMIANIYIFRLFKNYTLLKYLFVISTCIVFLYGSFFLVCQGIKN